MGKRRRPPQTQKPATGFGGVESVPETGAISRRKEPTGKLEQGPPQANKRPVNTDLIARAIRYLGLYLYIIIVYGGLLLTDYSIFRLVAWLVRDEIAKHYGLALLFDYLNVGLAIFIMLGALVHGFLSLVTLIKLDYAVSRELESNNDETQ